MVLKSSASNQANNTVGVNSTRNTCKDLAIKSNSQLAGVAPTASIESNQAYKSSGHLPSSAVANNSKVFRAASGYDDVQGLNERFIDLNKGQEPKVSKPTLATQVLKSTDFSNFKSSLQGMRHGEQT